MWQEQNGRDQWHEINLERQGGGDKFTWTLQAKAKGYFKCEELSEKSTVCFCKQENGDKIWFLVFQNHSISFKKFLSAIILKFD